MFDAVRMLLLFAVIIALLCVFSGDDEIITGCSDRPNGGGCDGVNEEEALAFGRCSFPGNFYSPVTHSSSCVNSRQKNSLDYPRQGIPLINQCGRGSFIVDGMFGCHPWLTCEDYAAGDLVLRAQIGTGAVKQVFLASWRGHKVAVSTPSTVDGVVVYRDDFVQGLSMHLLFQPSNHVVNFIGHCDDPPVIITEYHHHGNANNVDVALMSISADDDALMIRFGLCVDYAAIVQWLHDGPSGTRVMCDSSSLEKTLEQYLITDNFRLVLNDVDALPEVDRDAGLSIVCGHRQLRGTFVAPEQLWPHDDRTYDEIDMPGYDERTDIWKMPDVCEFFVRAAPNREVVLYRLFKLHTRCKSVAPERRPKALEILRTYESVWNELFSSLETL